MANKNRSKNQNQINPKPPCHIDLNACDKHSVVKAVSGALLAAGLSPQKISDIRYGLERKSNVKEIIKAAKEYIRITNTA